MLAPTRRSERNRAMRASEMPVGNLEVLLVPGIERAVRHVRQWLRDLLDPDDPVLDDLLVCCSEIVTNAVRYTDSGRDGQVRIELVPSAELVHLSVIDEGGARTVPHLVTGDGTAESGRGLRIVDACADEWGAKPYGKGLSVWVLFR